MKLKNRYIIGTHVMWYEVEMFAEHIESCIGMLKNVENKENVKFHFTINWQEYYEKIDSEESRHRIMEFINDLIYNTLSLKNGFQVKLDAKFTHEPFYNVADYRRDLNHNYCKNYNYILWGETDSLWPSQTLEIVEAIAEQTEYPKFILNFADRKMWDSSWDVITHPTFEKVKFIDDDVWPLENEASSKSYMSYERMEEINLEADFIGDIGLQLLTEPKFDGSCLVIASELIKSGVNIPQSLIHCGEDTSFGTIAKKLMGDQFVQYNVKNILHVHNRRHPQKRMYIKDENNPRGFCDNRKGDWWYKLENSSKHNLARLFTQDKFLKHEDL